MVLKKKIEKIEKLYSFLQLIKKNIKEDEYNRFNCTNAKSENEIKVYDL